MNEDFNARDARDAMGAKKNEKDFMIFVFFKKDKELI